LQPTRRAERAAAQADIAGGGTGTFQQDEIPNLSAKMTIMSTDDLVAEALRLPRRERARVAEELLSSLEEPADEVAAAWATELERRSQDVAEGRVQTVAWETARMEILKDLEERRASRSPS
jgi:putative addiction module component (TIGR02574 family)